MIAGFLTTERKRPYTGPPSTICSKSNGGKGKGSVAITAVFTEEAFRSRGVAESLVRTSTRYYLVDLEYDYVSVYVDPRNETTCRVFSRVGYGIMDREVKEEIPVKLIRDALHAQWEEEKARQQTLLEEEEDQEEQREVNAQLGQNDDEVDDTIHSYGVECDRSASLSTSYKASTHERSIESARDALSLLSAANAQIQANTEAHQAQAQSSNQAPKASSEAPARRASNATSAGSPINITTPNTESGNLIPTAEENEAALQAENGKPLCTSVEEWQVVSLKSREVALMESRSRVRGHARRDDSKRLSSEGPWH